MSAEIVRAEKDFSKEVDKLLPEAEQIAKVIIVRILCGLSLMRS
jgi:hypothetical protein